MSRRFLSPEEAKRFYDRVGRWQDWQRFYEGPPVELLLRHGRFDSAEAVFELGCGTGALAQRLLEEILPSHSLYVGVDLSATMVKIAQERLGKFGERARLVHTDGSLRFPFEDGTYDCFLSTYVLDLLPPTSIRNALKEAYRLLREGGHLCLAGLTFGRNPISRIVSKVWDRIHRLSPSLVGGCRPLHLRPFLEERRWKVLICSVVEPWGIPSEILVAQRRREMEPVQRRNA